MTPEQREREEIRLAGFLDGVTAALRTLESPVYARSPELDAATKRVRGILESRVRHMQKREDNAPRRAKKGTR